MSICPTDEIGYPFYTAEAAVTQQLCPHSALSQCFGTLRTAFTPSFGSPNFDGYGVKSGVRKGVQSIAFPSALFGAPFHIDNRTIAKCDF